MEQEKLMTHHHYRNGMRKKYGPRWSKGEAKASEKAGFWKRTNPETGTYSYQAKPKIKCENCGNEIYETDGDTFHTTKCRFCGHINHTSDLTYESKATEKIIISHELPDFFSGTQETGYSDTRTSTLSFDNQQELDEWIATVEANGGKVKNLKILSQESKATEYSIQEEYDLQDEDGKWEMLSKADVPSFISSDYAKMGDYNALPQNVKNQLHAAFGSSSDGGTGFGESKANEEIITQSNGERMFQCPTCGVYIDLDKDTTEGTLDMHLSGHGWTPEEISKVGVEKIRIWSRFRSRC